MNDFLGSIFQKSIWRKSAGERDFSPTFCGDFRDGFAERGKRKFYKKIIVITRNLA
jgi:hypothetical protein